MNEPLNQRLWNLVVTQARQRFNKYPSPAASHWVHVQYQLKGGRFKGDNKPGPTQRP